ARRRHLRLFLCYVLIFVWIQYSGLASASHGCIKIASLPPDSSIFGLCGFRDGYEPYLIKKKQ
ncbi:unnamed protein product, partial [Urochloa humidicola]